MNGSKAVRTCTQSTCILCESTVWKKCHSTGTVSALHGGYWHRLLTVELWGSRCLWHCYNPAFEEDLFRGLETKHSVEGIKCPPPKPSSLGCPPGGFPVSCTEIKVSAARGLWGLNLAAVRSPGIGRGRMRSQAATSSVWVSQGQYSDFWRGLLHFFPPSNAPLTYFLLIPRCDFNWLEGGAGRGEGCVCVF